MIKNLKCHKNLSTKLFFFQDFNSRLHVILTHTTIKKYIIIHYIYSMTFFSYGKNKNMKDKDNIFTICFFININLLSIIATCVFCLSLRYKLNTFIRG